MKAQFMYVNWLSTATERKYSLFIFHHSIKQTQPLVQRRPLNDNNKQLGNKSPKNIICRPVVTWY